MRKMKRVTPPISIRKRHGVDKGGCLMYIVAGIGMLGVIVLAV